MNVSALPEIIVVAGAPGTGKSTVCNALRAKLDAPLVELGRLREFHLHRGWTNKSLEEEAMSFENLVTITQNYLRHGYKPVLITDLLEFRVQQIPSVFSDNRFVIVTLICGDDELKRRVLEPTRDSGYRDVKRTQEWNAMVKACPLVTNEQRLDTTGQTVVQTVEAVIDLIEHD